MSRFHLYIAYLLIYTELVVSYHNYRRIRRRDLEEKPGFKRPFKKSRFKGSHVAQFDVASFIQKPDDVDVPDVYENAVVKSRRTSTKENNNPIHEINYDELNNKRSNFKKLANFDVDNADELSYIAPSSKDKVNEEQFKLTNFDDRLAMYQHDKRNQQDVSDSMAHNMEKKCSLKDMKFPFFFRKSKNEKKQKKRKLFCFNCSKKDSGIEITTSKVAGKNAGTAAGDKNNLKRSNKEKTRFNKVADKRQTSEHEIHSSREFYQEKKNNLKITDNTLEVPGNNNSADVNRNDIYDDSPSRQLENSMEDSSIEVREKRSEIDDNDRRLKLLDEIQRKVDSVEIRVPSYPKMHYESN